MLADVYDVNDLLCVSQAKVLETVNSENVVQLLKLLRRYEAHAHICSTLRELKEHVHQTESLRRAVTDSAISEL